MGASVHAELSERISRIRMSSTMEVAAEAERLRRQGVDVVDFSIGEPDFPTPEHIKEAALRAIRNNFTRYTSAAGIPELREAVCRRHAADFDTQYRMPQCLVTAGGSLGLLFAPSLPLILYGFVAGPIAGDPGVSIPDLFLAGLLPGLLMLLVLSAHAMWVGRSVPAPPQGFDAGELRAALWEARWELPLPLIVLTAVYQGVLAVSEVAALTAAYVLVVTVFAAAPAPGAPLSPFAHSLHRRWGHGPEAGLRRQEEDRAALALLGAEPLHWPYSDCIYRTLPDGRFAVLEDNLRTPSGYTYADAAREAVLRKVEAALLAHPGFVSAARPKGFARLMVSRYEGGQTYGTHVDEAFIGGARTDLSFTLFLSDPDRYRGGELVIEDRIEDRAFRARVAQLEAIAVSDRQNEADHDPEQGRFKRLGEPLVHQRQHQSGKENHDGDLEE